MEPSCVRQDQIPGTSRLYSDFLYHFERVNRFYPHNFLDFSSFSRAAAEIKYPDDRRAALVAALREQNGDSPSLEDLARPGTVAVVTGQQVGLLSGPCYTIFKALTAVKLAAELRASGTMAVPIFWLASEDHDLAEVDHVWLFGNDAKPAKITVANSVTNGGPVGEVVIEDIPLEDVRSALGELPFADEVFEAVKRAYFNGATFGASFKALVADILKGLGILFLDPLVPAVRRIAGPFLAETSSRIPELLEGLRARDRELGEAGYHSQVYLDEETSLLFLLGEGKRTPLRWRDGAFHGKDRTYSAADFSQVSEKLSPNALLRPVMQDYILPTVSYVGGPAEIAYMAQGQVLYEKLLGRMPVIFPRNSFTLLDNRAEKLVGRYQLSILDLLACQDKIKSKIAARLVPPALADELRALESTVTTVVESLQTHLAEFDPTLEAASKKSGAKMLHQIHRLTEKTARETLRRDERSTRDADYLINLIYPHRRLQERFYSILPFLAQHGMDLPARLLEMTQITCPDHMVRTV